MHVDLSSLIHEQLVVYQFLVKWTPHQNSSMARSRGMYRWSVFYPMMQSGGYSSANATAAAAEAVAGRARTDVELLKHDVDRLLLISEAIWTLLKREHGYSDDVLTDLITKIDLADGRIDGRGVKELPPQCPYCNRANSGRRSFCIYCGKPLPLNANPFSR